MEIKLEHVSKIFGETKALDDITLSLPSGNFIIILGPSGSGKSTLLRLLAGLEYPTKGRILFDHTDVTDLPASKRNVAMVFQKFPLFPHMTVDANMRFSLESQTTGNFFKERVFSDEEIDKRVNEVLDLLQLSEHRGKFPSQLSGGEQQRVAIGRELIREPVLYLYDEPLSNIDARLRFEMRAWLRGLHQRLEKTMVHVTHDQNEAMALGDLIVLLHEGRVIQTGSPCELYENPQERFVAEFVGNYPMNFMRFRVENGQSIIVGTDQHILPESVNEEIVGKDVTEGEIGFRAEAVSTSDDGAKSDDASNALVMECQIRDIEKILDRQVLTLGFGSHSLLWMDKSSASHAVGDSVSVYVNKDDMFVFRENGKRL